MNGKISYYLNASDSDSQIYVEINDVFQMIKRGYVIGEVQPRDIREVTAYLRGLLEVDKKQYKRQKEVLPMVAYTGEFSYRNTNLSNLQSYSNIFVLDFDFDNPTEEAIIELRQYLISNADQLHLMAVWRSVGKGIKAAMIHDNTHPEYHGELFQQIKQHYDSIGRPVDRRCSDICRTFYLNYDPELWMNDSTNLTQYHFVHSPSYIPPTTAIKGKTTYTVGKFIHTPEEIALNQSFQVRCSDKTLLNRLHKQFDKANPDYYKDGNRHNEIIKRATLFCKDGVLYTNAVFSLQGKFGPRSWAAMNDNDIEEMVSCCYLKARNDFGCDRNTYLDYKDGYIKIIKRPF